MTKRKFLRGIGTVVALPYLEGIAPVLAQSKKVEKPLRMACLFVPNGINMAHWTPGSEGQLLDLPSTLGTLEPIKKKFSIFTGLAQRNAFALGDGPGDHARSSAAWLTGMHPRKTSGADISAGISADQLAAQYIGSKTRFPSLELGCERGALAGDCDSGYSCAYSNSISWKGPSTPVAKETNPRLVFERLFGSGHEGEDAESRMRRQRYKSSILDFVLGEAEALNGRLGKRDQQKLDEYLTAVREVEVRLQRVEREALKSNNPNLIAPKSAPKELAEHIRLMGDMMILAFQADLTRICTFMFANEGSNRSYRSIGVPEGHHDISHHGNAEDKLAKKAQIDAYHLEQLAYILRRMNEIQDVDGTLLDNSMILYGGGISDGNKHNHDDLPILFAGGAGGAFRQGRHIKIASNTPLNNLLLSVVDRLGVHAEKLGDSTGKLTGIF